MLVGEHSQPSICKDSEGSTKKVGLNWSEESLHGADSSEERYSQCMVNTSNHISFLLAF